MKRIAVIGNSSGGKSTLSRRLAARRGLPWVEIDRFLWQPGWDLAPTEDYEAEHARIVAQDRWVLDGLGRLDSLPSRLARAELIVLIDLPLGEHFRLAQERQSAWAVGPLENPPAGASEAPPTEALLRTIREIERDWMPEIRDQVEAQHAVGKDVRSLRSLREVQAFDLGEPEKP